MFNTQQVKSEDQIKSIIHEENSEKLCDMIKKGQLPLTAIFKNKDTVLHIIVSYKKHNSLLKWLLEHRPEVNINATNDTQSTPLIIAADASNFEAMKLLIAHGAKPELKSKFDETARVVLARHLPDKVSLYDQAIQTYQDKKKSPSFGQKNQKASNQFFQEEKKESLSNKPKSSQGVFSFLDSFISTASKKDDQIVPLLTKKTQ